MIVDWMEHDRVKWIAIFDNDRRLIIGSSQVEQQHAAVLASGCENVVVARIDSKPVNGFRVIENVDAVASEEKILINSVTNCKLSINSRLNVVHDCHVIVAAREDSSVRAVEAEAKDVAQVLLQHDLRRDLWLLFV